MSNLDVMGNASYERRQQNIMRLRRAVKDGQVFTIQSAENLFGYSRATIVSWAKEGKIKLYDPETKDWVK